MQRTPRRGARGGRPNYSSPSYSTSSRPGGKYQKSSPRGLFSNGVWHCDCDPRLPAEHFKVKKAGKNQGRWFYTCQLSEGQRCGFFLWGEEAKVREEGAVLGNSRSEVESIGAGSTGKGRADSGSGGDGQRKGLFGNRGGGSGRREDDDESTLSPSPSASRSSAAAKRKADAAGFASEEDSDEAFPWPLTGEEEKELAKIDTFETPRKATKTGVYATPATSTVKRKLPWLMEDDTPQTPTTSTSKQLHQKNWLDDKHLDTPSKPPTTATGWEGSKTKEYFGLATENHSSPNETSRSDFPTTPAALPPADPASPSPPTRYTNALSNPADDTSTLTHAVLATLSKLPSPLPPEILSELRSTLTKFDLRTQGIAKGRDISRIALKAKEARIAELMGKIEGLEAEREVQRGVVRGLKRGP